MSNFIYIDRDVLQFLSTLVNNNSLSNFQGDTVITVTVY